MQNLQKLFRCSTLILFIVIFCYSNVYSQVPENNIIVYDVVYLKNGQVLKGEIIIFEEKDGDITFKDFSGKKYSITRDEYKYFLEDQRYYLGNEGDTLRINLRKTNEFEFEVGFNIGSNFIKNDFSSDDYYLGISGGQIFSGIDLRFAFGKYFNRQNFVAIVGSTSVFTDSRNYFDLGIRYKYQYDNYKKNRSLYIPFELKYARAGITESYTTSDSIFYDWGYTYPANVDLQVNVNYMAISVGQGFSFIFENKKSIDIEFIISKSIFVARNFVLPPAILPKNQASISGVKLGVFYNI